MDGKDGTGLKLEKLANLHQVVKLCLGNIAQNLQGLLSLVNSFYIFLIMIQGIDLLPKEAYYLVA